MNVHTTPVNDGKLQTTTETANPHQRITLKKVVKIAIMAGKVRQLHQAGEIFLEKNENQRFFLNSTLSVRPEMYPDAEGDIAVLCDMFNYCELIIYDRDVDKLLNLCKRYEQKMKWLEAEADEKIRQLGKKIGGRHARHIVKNLASIHHTRHSGFSGQNLGRAAGR